MSMFGSNYEAPKSNSDNYFKILKGENRIRILSTCVFGWEVWADKVVTRLPHDKKPNVSSDSKVKFFVSFLVYDYESESIKIFNITQSSIRKTLETLDRDKEWGSAHQYDIKISREGEGMETDYHLSPMPPKPVSDSIKLAFNLKRAWLPALFENEDPFDVKWSQSTPSLFDVPLAPFKDESKALAKPSILATELVMELETLLSLCDPRYKDEVFEKLLKVGITNLNQLNDVLYRNIYAQIVKKKQEYEEFQRAENELIF